MTNMNYNLQSPPTSGYVIIIIHMYILLSSVIIKNRNIILKTSINTATSYCEVIYEIIHICTAVVDESEE